MGVRRVRYRGDAAAGGRRILTIHVPVAAGLIGELADLVTRHYPHRDAVVHPVGDDGLAVDVVLADMPEPDPAEDVAAVDAAFDGGAGR